MEEVAPKTDIELLREHFEPEVLKENYLTKEDQLIKDTDLPERYVLRDRRLFKQTGEGKRTLSRVELMVEAEWIASKLDYTEELSEAVEKVLTFMHLKNLDIPFIFHYLKDELHPHLKDYKILWSIFDLDEKYVLFQNKKLKFKERMLLMEEEEEAQKMLISLDHSKSEEELDDIFNNFQFMFGEDLAEIERKHLDRLEKEKDEKEIDNLLENDISVLSSYLDNNIGSSSSSSTKNLTKKPIKRNFFHECKKEGYLEIAKRFGISASEFGDNLLKDYLFKEPKDDPFEPLLLVQQSFPHLLNLDSALQKLRKLISLSIFNDPKVRAFFRSLYQDNSCIFTSPTNKGKKEIDAFHLYYVTLFSKFYLLLFLIIISYFLLLYLISYFLFLIIINFISYYYILFLISYFLLLLILFLIIIFYFLFLINFISYYYILLYLISYYY